MSKMWRLLLSTTFLFANFVFIINARGLTLPIVDDRTPIPQPGRVCAYGDMDKDRYTDLVVQRGSKLFVLLQSEAGVFKDDPKHGMIDLGRNGEVYCSVGDFNGEASPDILVTSSIKHEVFTSSIYIQNDRGYTEIPLNQSYVDQPVLMDINGDGISDIIGFVKNGSRNSISCISGSRSSTYEDCSHRFIDADFSSGPVPSFPHIFADLDGDLSSEIIFGLNDDKVGLQLSVWKLDSSSFTWRNHKDIIPPWTDNPDWRYFAAPLVNDFNSDGANDVLIPICNEKECTHIDKFLVWSDPSNKWEQFRLDMKDAEIITEPNSIVAFRVGEFDLEGYPDLIATVRINGFTSPIILKNSASDAGNFSRKFELSNQKDFRIIMPSDMAKSTIVFSSFFDLKEDGNLDILVEYKTDVATFIDFIKCDDKGDTTFLKVQIFSNVCADCPGTSSSDKGSGIAWFGACASYSMSTSFGPPKRSVQCQLPQSSHRVFHSPFVLFGLGRSPNFVDEVVLGSPRWPNELNNQRHSLKQIVPNSRIVVVPPEREGTFWQVRLYLTPSQLIIQSLLVQISVCFVLSCLAIGLHLKEQQADKRERQQQSHRFHFNAL